jgi:DNA-directed RNA polymerase specialized sigma24 family protein
MASVGSVTVRLPGLKEGDQKIIQSLWEDYFRRLVVLARRRLQGVPRGAADEEDVALSAFDSFCRGAEEGRFPRLNDRHDLWQLLVLIARRKAFNLAKHERTQKAGGGRVVHMSVLSTRQDRDEAAFARLIGREPDPAFAAQVAEDCRRLLALLAEAQLRDVAVWKLEGYTNVEIANKLGRAVSTVERKLDKIRAIWDRERNP